MHRACVPDRVMPHHNSTRPFHSIFKPLKQSAWSWLERTICCCRQQARTTFHVKASKPRPPRWPATHFMFSKDHALLRKLPSSLGVSTSPEFRPAGTGRLLLVLFSSYRIKTLVMLSPSDRLHFAVLCLECQEQAVSNSSWGLGAV